MVAALFLCALLRASVDDVTQPVQPDAPAQQISGSSPIPRIAEDAGGYALQTFGGLACGAACHGVVGLCGAGVCGAAWEMRMGRGEMALPALLLLPVVAWLGFWFASIVFLPLPILMSVGVDSALLGVRLLVSRGLGDDARAIALLSHLAMVPPLVVSAVFLVAVTSVLALMAGLWLLGASPTAPVGKDLVMTLAGAWLLAVALLVFGHMLRSYVYSAVRWTQVMRGCGAADRRRGTCRDPLGLDPRAAR